MIRKESLPSSFVYGDGAMIGVVACSYRVNI